MGFFKKFLSKENHELSEEDKLKLNTILKGEQEDIENIEDYQNPSLNDVAEPNNTQTNLDLKNLVEQLDSNQIRELRFLLDEKDAQMNNNSDSSDKKSNEEEYIYVDNSKDELEEVEGVITKEEIDKENIEEIEDISEIPIDSPFEIQEVDDINNINEKKSNDEDYIYNPESDDNLDEIEIDNNSRNNNEIIIEDKNNEKENIIKSESQDIKDDIFEIKEDHPIIEKSILEKIKDIFGAENVFEKVDTKSKHEIINGKNIQYIGIRKFDAFDNQDTTLDQNAWFISNIKKLHELKQFKMIESNPTLKELIFENENNPILLSYKSTQLLKDKETFEFF